MSPRARRLLPGLLCAAALLACAAERPSRARPPVARAPQAPAAVEQPASAPAQQAAAEAPGPRYLAPGPDGYGRAGSLRYLELVRGADAQDVLPMVVVIHGLGDAPGPHWLDVVAPAHPVRLILPEAPTPHGSGFSWFEYRAASADPAQLAAGIAAAEERLADALAILVRQRPTRGRPLVTGFSQGGMLSFALALRHPALVAQALPVSGTLPEPLWPANGPGPDAPAIVALHGDADPVVDFELTARLVEHLRARGYEAELLAFPGVRHSIALAMRQALGRRLDEALAALR